MFLCGLGNNLNVIEVDKDMFVEHVMENMLVCGLTPRQGIQVPVWQRGVSKEVDGRVIRIN